MTLVSFSLVSASTQSGAPFSLGHAFKQGQVPAGQSVVATGAASFQVTPKNAWPDGSLKFAILSGTANLTAATPLAIALDVGAAAGGTALTTTQLKATGITASVDCGAFGAVSWATTDWDSPFQSWVSGPVMSSWVYRKPVGSDPHLVAWLEVRLFASGAVEVLPWLENGYILVAGPTNKSATYSFTLGGTSRCSVAINLGHHARTPIINGAELSYWLGSDPGVSVLHDRAYLQATELVPTYSAVLQATELAVTGQPTTYAPLQVGRWIYDGDYMGSTGYQRPIGLLPEHDVVYLTAVSSVHAAMWAAVQRNGYSAGRYCVHYRDETTLRPLRFSDYPHLTIGTAQGFKDAGASSTGSYTPAITGSHVPWDTAHAPSMGFLPYLLTGRWYHMETVQFVAGVNFLGPSDVPQVRDGSKGLVRPADGAFQTRSCAWAWRSLVQALCATPDTDTALRNEYIASVQYNLDHFAARYVDQANNPFGIVGPGESYAYNTATIGVFQQDFITAAFGYSMGLGLPLSTTYQNKLSAFFSWKAKSTTGRLGSFASGGFPYVNADCYVISVSDNTAPDYVTGTGPWRASWDAIWTNLPTALASASSPSDWLGYVDGTLRAEGGGPGERSLWGNFMAGLAYAVRYAVPGAKTGYDRVTGASNFATMMGTPFNSNPVWAVAPAVIPSEASGMGDTLRIDTTELISGALVIGDTGLGVLGSVVRSDTATGPNGAGILYNDWDTGDDNKEFRALVLSGAPAGTFFYEDGSFSVPGGTADGTYPVSYRLFVDGVDMGTSTATITIGAGGGDTTAPTLTSPTASATGQTTGTASVTTNEANGTLYRLVNTSPTASTATVKASGTTTAISSTGVKSGSISGLTAATTYYVHWVHTDAAGNDSAVANSGSFTTSAAPAPGPGPAPSPSPSPAPAPSTGTARVAISATGELTVLIQSGDSKRVAFTADGEFVVLLPGDSTASIAISSSGQISAVVP